MESHPAFTKRDQQEAECITSPAASASTSRNILNVNVESQQLLEEFEQVTSRAQAQAALTQANGLCPICRDAPRDVAYVMPCCQLFCLGCILRGLDVKGECPVCRGPVEIVQFPVRGENDYIECFTMHPGELQDARGQAGTAPSHPAKNSPHHPMASPEPSPQGTLSPHEQGTAGPEAEAVSGILPEVWAAELFQTEDYLLHPLRPWLRLELQAIRWARCWQARHAEADILHTLCVSGPVADAVVQVLQPGLGECGALLVHGIIKIIVDCCSQEARGMLRSRAVWEDDDSSAAGSSSTSLSSTTSLVVHGSRGNKSSATACHVPAS